MESPCITLVLLLCLFTASLFYFLVFGGRDDYVSSLRAPCDEDCILNSSAQTPTSSRNVDKYPHDMIKLVTDEEGNCSWVANEGQCIEEPKSTQVLPHSEIDLQRNRHRVHAHPTRTLPHLTKVRHT